MDDEPKVLQKESLKLVKNTKGYTWEIKTLPLHEILDERDIERLQDINDSLVEKYGEFNND